MIGLLILALLPLGCGGDDKGDPPEDAFDSQGEDGEIVEKPFVSVSGFDEGEMTTAESTITLEGTTFYSDTVIVGDENATLGEEVQDGVHLWSFDVELQEGSNSLQIKAATNDGLEGEPVEVVVVYDPDYVPDPPENMGPGDVGCWITDVIRWDQKNEYYDPVGSRPDEMHIDIVSDWRGNSQHSFYSDANRETIVSTGGATAIMPAQHSATYRIDVHAWEEDDGFWTGGDDEVGTGSVELTILFTEGRASHRLRTDVGGNTFTVDLVYVCEAW